MVGGRAYAAAHDVSRLRSSAAPRRPVLPQLRGGRGDPARDRGTQDGHGAVRRSRRFDGARATPRPGARARGLGQVLRRGHRGAASAPRPAGEVHRRCGDGDLRPPDGPRGRRAPRGPGGARDPRTSPPRGGRARARRPARGARGDRVGRGGHRPGSRGAAPGHRAGRERGGPAPDRGRTRRGARGRDDARAHRDRGRVRGAPQHPREGVLDGPARATRWKDSPPGPRAGRSRSSGDRAR